MTTSITDEKYVSLTTYKRDGSTKALPVWIVDLGDGTCGFTTASSSFKVKRISSDERIILQASDSRGRPTDGSTPVEGTAIASTADFAAVRALVKGKYRFGFVMVTVIGKLAKLVGKGSESDTAVIITLAR